MVVRWLLLESRLKTVARLFHSSNLRSSRVFGGGGYADTTNQKVGVNLKQREGKKKQEEQVL